MMKKIVVLMLFICINFAVAKQIKEDSVFVSILKNVSIPNVHEAINDTKNLEQNLTQENFKKLVSSWKKVEALYFAGEIDENYIDTPRFIDVFHNLKEDLNEQMQRVIESNDEPIISLYKNSFKTINALEYVLFNDDKISKRDAELSKIILKIILSNLNDILDVYNEYISNPKTNEKWENSLLINTMIASTYRLKEWRIAEVAGISSKYKNNPDYKRSEYFVSQNSLNSIKSIIQAHKSIMTNQNYMNFNSKKYEFGISNQMDVIEKTFKDIDTELLNFKEKDLENTQKTKALYEKVVKLHNAYYFSLLEQLSITSKIVDADGD